MFAPIAETCFFCVWPHRFTFLSDAPQKSNNNSQPRIDALNFRRTCKGNDSFMAHIWKWCTFLNQRVSCVRWITNHPRKTKTYLENVGLPHLLGVKPAPCHRRSKVPQHWFCRKLNITPAKLQVYLGNSMYATGSQYNVKAKTWDKKLTLKVHTNKIWNILELHSNSRFGLVFRRISGDAERGQK